MKFYIKRNRQEAKEKINNPRYISALEIARASNETKSLIIIIVSVRTIVKRW